MRAEEAEWSRNEIIRKEKLVRGLNFVLGLLIAAECYECLQV